MASKESSEFSWGRGLVPNPGTGYPLSPYDRLRATRMTDPSNPEANEDDVYTQAPTRSHLDRDGLNVPGTLRPGVTQPVHEDGELPSSGQHQKIYTDRYNSRSVRPGREPHDPEGYQDGAGQAWRDSIPPNPVT